MRAAEHAPSDPYCVLERRHGVAEIVERGAVGSVERLPVIPPYFERGNKLISGLRDSAVSWAIILPLYYYCEKGAAAA